MCADIMTHTHTHLATIQINQLFMFVSPLDIITKFIIYRAQYREIILFYRNFEKYFYINVIKMLEKEREKAWVYKIFCSKYTYFEEDIIILKFKFYLIIQINFKIWLNYNIIMIGE